MSSNNTIKKSSLSPEDFVRILVSNSKLEHEVHTFPVQIDGTAIEYAVLRLSLDALQSCRVRANNESKRREEKGIVLTDADKSDIFTLELLAESSRDVNKLESKLFKASDLAKLLSISQLSKMAENFHTTQMNLGGTFPTLGYKELNKYIELLTDTVENEGAKDPALFLGFMESTALRQLSKQLASITIDLKTKMSSLFGSLENYTKEKNKEIQNMEIALQHKNLEQIEKSIQRLKDIQIPTIQS